MTLIRGLQHSSAVACELRGAGCVECSIAGSMRVHLGTVDGGPNRHRTRTTGQGTLSKSSSARTGVCVAGDRVGLTHSPRRWNVRPYIRSRPSSLHPVLGGAELHVLACSRSICTGALLQVEDEGGSREGREARVGRMEAAAAEPAHASRVALWAMRSPASGAHASAVVHRPSILVPVMPS